MIKPTKVRKHNVSRVCQGDILRDIDHVEDVVVRNGKLKISQITFPLVIVLTQDCDLEQDYRVRWSRTVTSNQDKMLVSALVAPLYNLEHFKSGEHLKDLGRTMQQIQGSSKENLLKTNQTARYHYLEFSGDVPVVPSVIDFKHYFSCNVAYLKRLKSEQFVCKVADMYREDICQRFASFLSRIGLP